MTTVDKVYKFIVDNRLLAEGDRCIAALSGGADSVAMLHILLMLSKKLGIELFAAHLNHMIRGTEAERDARYCQELCCDLGIELFMGHADVPTLSRESGRGYEETGRCERYRFLRSLVPGALIATAHTMNDNAETVMLDLARGTGPSGLTGIPLSRDGMIRPVLCLERDETEKYCVDNSLEYMTDSSNLIDDCARNRIRHQCLPVLCSVNSSAVRHIARTGEILRDDNDCLDALAQRVFSDALSGSYVSVDKLIGMAPAIQRRVLIMYIRRFSTSDFEMRHIESAREMLFKGGSVVLPGGNKLVSKNGRLHFEIGQDDDPGLWSVPVTDMNGVCECPSGKVQFSTVAYSDINFLQKSSNSLCTYIIDCDKISNHPVLRCRLPGDRFTSRRRGCTKTLGKLFREACIPERQRQTSFVFADDESVICVEGFGVSAPYIPDDDTQNILVMRLIAND